MALALVVLAAGSVVAGWIGIPHALGGHNLLHAWLEPSFIAPGAAGAAVVSETAAEIAAHESLELTLMGVSTAGAFAGIAVAWLVWVRRRELAEQAARRFAGLHRLLLNKYYVDEIYDATIVQPIKVASTDGLWRGFDVRVIDGAVNGTGTLVNWLSSVLRLLQTGSVRAYARSFFIGVVVILGYYLWR